MFDCKGIRYASLSVILLKPRISITTFFFSFRCFAWEMHRFPNYKYGIPVFGGIFYPLHFALTMQFVEFLIDNGSVLKSDRVHFGCVDFNPSFGVDDHPLVLWYFDYLFGITPKMRVKIHHVGKSSSCSVVFWWTAVNGHPAREHNFMIKVNCNGNRCH